MKQMKKLTAALLSLGLAASALSGCATTPISSNEDDIATFPAGTTVVGISMSGSQDASAEQLKTDLEGAGYGVVLSYAGGDSNTQVNQLNDMMKSKCSILILDAVDQDSADHWLSSQAASVNNGDGTGAASSVTPQEAGFQVIACDTYLTSSLVTAYIGTDYRAMGAAQGNYLAEALGLTGETAPTTPLVVEFVAGDSELDALILEGAMEVLGPYVESGSLVIPSGNTTFEAVSSESPAAYISSLITTTYAADAEIDAIVTTSSAVADAVLNVLQEQYTGSVYPIVSSALCDLAGAQSLRGGFLSMTSIEAPLPEDWGAQAAALVQQIKDGEAVSDVLTAGTAVTKENFDEVLIQSGLFAYDDADQLVEGSGVPAEPAAGDEDSGE